MMAESKEKPFKLPKAERLHKAVSRSLPSNPDLPSTPGGSSKPRAYSVTPDPAIITPQQSQPPSSSEAADTSDASGTQEHSGFESSEGKSVMLVATSPSTVAWKRMRRGSLRKQEVCTPVCFFKYLIVLGCLQGVTVLSWAMTFILGYFYYPAAIISRRLEERESNDLNRLSWVVMWIFGLEPTCALLIFAICLPLSRRKPHLIRIYYLMATWLLPLLLVAGIMVLFFAGKLTLANVEKELTLEMLMYDEINTNAILLQNSSKPVDELSHKSIDSIQVFFQCCGIRNYSDWKRIARGFFDYEDKVLDPKYWMVPSTCCSTTVELELRRCVQDPDANVKFIWKSGCLRHVLNMLRRIGVSLGVSLMVNFVIQIWTIATATCYYASTRSNDGSGYGSGFQTFAFECFCMHLCKKPKPNRRRHVSVLPINPHEEDLIDAETSLMVLEKTVAEKRKRESVSGTTGKPKKRQNSADRTLASEILPPNTRRRLEPPQPASNVRKSSLR